MPGAAMVTREMTTCVIPFTAAFCSTWEERQVTHLLSEQINKILIIFYQHSTIYQSKAQSDKCMVDKDV